MDTTEKSFRADIITKIQRMKGNNVQKIKWRCDNNDLPNKEYQ